MTVPIRRTIRLLAKTLPDIFVALALIVGGIAA
jgi:hypothetical protein